MNGNAPHSLRGIFLRYAVPTHLQHMTLHDTDGLAAAKRISFAGNLMPVAGNYHLVLMIARIACIIQSYSPLIICSSRLLPPCFARRSCAALVMMLPVRRCFQRFLGLITRISLEWNF